MKSVVELFWSKVDVGWTDDCWTWTASLFRVNGYGQFSSGRNHGLSVSAHRVAYELIKGPVPEGLQLDHLCRNRACVNPQHLEAVTPKENVRREREANGFDRSIVTPNKGRTHCKRGHSEWGRNSVQRYCIPCARVRRAQDNVKRRKVS